MKRDWEDLQRHAVRMGRDPKPPGVRALQLHAPRGDGEPRAGGRGVAGAVPPRDGDAPELGAPAGVLHGGLRRPDQRAHRRPGRRPAWSTWCSARSATTRGRSTCSPARDARLRVSAPAAHRRAHQGGDLRHRRDPRASVRRRSSSPRWRRCSASRSHGSGQHRATDALALTDGRMTLREFYAPRRCRERAARRPAAAVARHLAVYAAATARLDARVLALIQELRRRHRRGVPHRTPRSRSDEFNRERGLFPHFDRAFLSTELGLHKPDREIFERVLADLGCAPRRPCSPTTSWRTWRERERPACRRSTTGTSRVSRETSRALLEPEPEPVGAKYVGAVVRRREDPRLLIGRGRYVDDLRPFGCLHAAILRSPHAHARIRRIGIDRARRHPAVAACFTYADLAPPLRPLPQRRRPAALAPGPHRLRPEDGRRSSRWLTSGSATSASRSR